jgi:hypothetical protein
MVSRQPNRKLYRTMQGRMVDIEKLRATNEEVRAVGNMSVNARGDVVGNSGKIIKTKEQLMKEYYEAPKGKADDTPAKRVRTEPTPQQEVVKTQVINPVEQTQQAKNTPSKTTNQFKPKQGIDAALDGLE